MTQKVPADYCKNRLQLIRAMEFGIQKLEEEKKFTPDKIEQIKEAFKVIKSNKTKHCLCLEPNANYAISYSRDINNPFEKSKRILTTLGRYVRRQLGTTAEALPDAVLDAFQNDSIGHVRYKTELAELKVLKGYDIRRYYELSRMVESCMMGQASYRTEMYALNPERVSLLTFKNEGRALLWDLPDGTKYMDRCYGNHKINSLFAVWAESNGYQQYAKGFRPQGEMTLNVNRYLPSIDTFFYIKFSEDKKTGVFSTRNFPGSHQHDFNKINVPGMTTLTCKHCHVQVPDEPMYYLKDKTNICEKCANERHICIVCREVSQERDTENMCPVCAAAKKAKLDAELAAKKEAARKEKEDAERKAAELKMKELEKVSEVETVKQEAPIKDPKVCANKMCGFSKSKAQMLKIKKIGGKRSIYVCCDACAKVINPEWVKE